MPKIWTKNEQLQKSFTCFYLNMNYQGEKNFYRIVMIWLQQQCK